MTDEERKKREILFRPEQILSHVRPNPVVHSALSTEEKIEKISGHMTQIMETLGLDLRNESLADTPRRVAKMFVSEIFRGLDPTTFPKISVIENEMQYDEMIVVKDISLMSLCEHHFVTIEGKANIAYIPNNRVIGLSKINRIAHYFARFPQVQERLTKQIADCLCYVLDTNNVAVFINAKHFCVVARGVEDVSSTTTTSDLRGEFRENPNTRAEFLSHCRN